MPRPLLGQKCGHDSQYQHSKIEKTNADGKNERPTEEIEAVNGAIEEMREEIEVRRMRSGIQGKTSSADDSGRALGIPAERW
jgi:hypothetical protein